MVESFQALAVAIVALLPGACYLFNFERVVGSFGVSASDRLIRFLAASAVFAALFSGLGLLAYRQFVVTGRLQAGAVNWLFFNVTCLGYVLVPSAAGAFVGFAYKKDWAWARLLTGNSPEPRAWDYLWRTEPQALVRLKVKDGPWLAGVFGTTASGLRSYAAGYPEPQDLFLAEQVEVDPDSGAFSVEDDGTPRLLSPKRGLLLRWEEIEYLDFQEIAT